MKVAKMVNLRLVGNMVWRVVTQQDDLGPLESQHTVGLDPTAIVADAHSHHAAEGPPGPKAEIAHLKVAFLQILKRMVRMAVGVAGQVNLAIFANDAAIGGDEHAGVVAVLDASLDGK